MARLRGIAALLALWPVSGMLTPLALTLATMAVVTVVAAIELVWLAPEPLPGRHRRYDPDRGVTGSTHGWLKRM